MTYNYWLYVAALATVAMATPLPAQDTSFAGMQQRGMRAMGVDQYTSVHTFDQLTDGGRIELQRDRDDSVGVRAIRSHLGAIQKAFQSGDFSTPAFVHMQAVPGTTDMARLRGVIRYSLKNLPRGGELRITSTNPEAVKAVHAFLAFQRGEHHAAGHDMHTP
ncbi:MAG: hypothetical protein ABI664_11180 [bacterium]